MRGLVPPDPQGGVSNIEFAVVFTPKRIRKRFSANCVEIKASAKEAISSANNKNKKFAAKLLGPSKSSEGQIIYYLIEWLD